MYASGVAHCIRHAQKSEWQTTIHQSFTLLHGAPASWNSQFKLPECLMAISGQGLPYSRDQSRSAAIAWTTVWLIHILASTVLATSIRQSLLQELPM